MKNSDLYHPVHIGSLVLPGNIFLAPVAGYTDRAFRSLCVDCGASFTYTEMVSAEALTRGSGKTEKILLRASNEYSYAVQIFGSDPKRMADATSIVLETTHAECIDINAGCPVPKIWKNGAGSALTRDPQRLAEITSAVKKAAGAIPVTVKIRSGWDEKNLTWKEAAEAAILAGASAITLHPRTRAQGYEGFSKWEILSELTSFVHSTYPNIPVFGSGDLFSPEAAKKMLEQTNCDAVMFARGATGNPFIFTQTIDFLKSGHYSEIMPQHRISAGWRELLQLVQDSGEISACREMRKRFCAYSKGIEGGNALRLELVKAEKIEDYRRILTQAGFETSEEVSSLANSSPYD
ncbi:MAG TPA: tRNA dihydrouridine synthase DusB [Treponemataceae bacterium]|nr:tRNA dihydrouridine synthase DusB [Treponemataceae bacterium]